MAAGMRMASEPTRTVPVLPHPALHTLTTAHTEANGGVRLPLDAWRIGPVSPPLSQPSVRECGVGILPLSFRRGGGGGDGVLVGRMEIGAVSVCSLREAAKCRDGVWEVVRIEGDTLHKRPSRCPLLSVDRSGRVSGGALERPPSPSRAELPLPHRHRGLDKPQGSG